VIAETPEEQAIIEAAQKRQQFRLQQR
jgi:hypothetical protein